jgi:hypothetical protein
VTFWENALYARADGSGSDGFTHEPERDVVEGHRLLVVQDEDMYDDMLAIIAHYPDDGRHYHGDHEGETDDHLRNVQAQLPIYAYRPAPQQHPDAPYHWTIFSGWDGSVTEPLYGRVAYWLRDIAARDEGTGPEWSFSFPSATPHANQYGTEAGARDITDYTTDGGQTMEGDTPTITRQLAIRDLDDNYRF